MNYAKHYELLISRAQSREKPVEYCEKHHIIPKCLGGADISDNLVFLTYDEHCLAHLLLMKMHPDNFGIASASVAMCFNSRNHKRIPRKQRIWARLRFIAMISEFSKNRSPEHQDKLTKARMLKIGEISAKISAKLKGVPLSEETKKKLSVAHTGKKLSPEHIEKIRIGNTGKFRSAESKKKMSEASRGKPKSEQHRAKISQTSKGRSPSLETREKLRQAFAGIPRSEEVKAKIRETKRLKKEQNARCT